MDGLHISEAMRHARMSRSLSAIQVADTIGVSANYVRRIERGGYDNISVSFLHEYADAIGVETWKIIRHAARLRANAEGGQQ